MNRDFKGVWIPKDIYLDKRLNALDKIILVEIDSLDNGEDGCFASNEYLSEFCQCSQTKVSTAISKLIDCGYIEMAGFDGRKRILKSRLSKNESQTFRNLKADIKKVKHNNIDNKIVNIINYLNEKLGTKYKANTKATKSIIKARLDEGFTVDDFRKVIDKKVAQWKGTEMEQYLRPQTLFGTKMESYLNQNIVKEEKKMSEPRRYKEFEPEPEIDAVPMPDEVRRKANALGIKIG